MSAPLAVEGIPRREQDNPFQYTEDQMAARKLAVKQAMELYPGVAQLHAEWAYDLCVNTPPEELQEIMHRVDTNPSRREEKIGGLTEKTEAA